MKSIILTLITIVTYNTTDAQFLKKIGKKAEEAVERAIERKVEEKAEQKTEQVIDSVLNKDRKTLKKKSDEAEKQTKSESFESLKKNEKIEILKKNGFIPGNQVVFEDNFIQDQTGDFPVNWETNGSGEIVIIQNKKYLKLSDEAMYIPMYNEKLSENYTLEFDIMAPNLDEMVSSLAWLKIYIDDNNTFNLGQNYAEVDLNFCQYLVSQTYVHRIENGKTIIKNKLNKDYREIIKGKTHVSIMVNKTRLRLWLNEEKLIDIPKLVPKNKTGFIKIMCRNIEKEGLYLSDFKLAKTGVDKRSKLITEGKVSYNDILFESGADKLKPSSFKSISEIANILKNNPSIKIKIIGHTDSDGTEQKNKTLSQKRAIVVKNVLIQKYGIDNTRLLTEGKGESEPLESNSTNAGKAKNRRVEFIKL